MMIDRATGRLLALYGELERIATDYSPMPDNAMDALRDAASIVREAIINAPVACETDVANKLRLAAIMVEAAMADEMPVIHRAADDLAALRNRQWLEDHARLHPTHGEPQ
jgi:hypothetical protein